MFIIPRTILRTFLNHKLTFMLWGEKKDSDEWTSSMKWNISIVDEKWVMVMLANVGVHDKNYLGLIWLFKFPWVKSIIYVISHFCFQLLGQVMHFCRCDCVALMETYFKFLHFFSSIVTYWHSLKKDAPNKVP